MNILKRFIYRSPIKGLGSGVDRASLIRKKGLTRATVGSLKPDPSMQLTVIELKIPSPGKNIFGLIVEAKGLQVFLSTICRYKQALATISGDT